MASKNQRTNRRKFIRTTSTAVAAAFSVAGFMKEHVTHAADKHRMSATDRSKRLMEQFKLKYPIFQAAPGGSAVAIAMSEAGCMGSLQLGPMPADQCREVVTDFTRRGINFYGNFVLHFSLSNLETALSAGLRIVQFSWGIPDASAVEKIRAFQAKLGIQVGSKAGAVEALKHHPDFLICQGVEAGGHVQGNEPLSYSLREVVNVAGDIPVLASGGIATGKDIRSMLEAGAAGIVMGTRLIATSEGEIHPVYKECLVNARENSTVFTNCFDKGWPAMHRVLKNKTYEMWEAAGCPLPGKRPGENDIIATSKNGTPIERYSQALPGSSTTGQLKEMALYAGTGVKDVNDIPSVGELIPRLWKEFENG